MNIVYAYPWDIAGDPAAADRFARLSADAVAIAAAYHTTRAATPFHPRHRVVDAAHAACYVPVRPAAWRDSRLIPARPGWMPHEAPHGHTGDPFGAARDALHASGVRVHAWVILTHNSLLGTAHPDLVVRNAFGDTYPYALCPSAPDVTDYCERLLSEVVTLGEPDGVILEACGPLGLRHGGHHEKTEGADWTAVQVDLLSLCFCTACAARYTAAGLDPGEIAVRVRAGADAADPPGSVDEALGDHAPAVRKVRAGIANDLRRCLITEARRRRPGIRITLHASAGPWATGPFATVAPVNAHDRVDHKDLCLVGNCWGAPERAVAGLKALRELGGARIGAYVLALPPTDPAALPALTERFASAGADEIHMYHGGLASKERLDAIEKALAGRR